MKLEVLREHDRIAEWFWHCRLAMQLWSESTQYFSDNPVNPDFRLLDPDGDLDRHQNVSRWSLGHALVPLQDIWSKSVHNFFTYPTDRQSDKNITSFFGRGNNNMSVFICSQQCSSIMHKSEVNCFYLHAILQGLCLLYVFSSGLQRWAAFPVKLCLSAGQSVSTML